MVKIDEYILSYFKDSINDGLDLGIYKKEYYDIILNNMCKTYMEIMNEIYNK